MSSSTTFRQWTTAQDGIDKLQLVSSVGPIPSAKEGEVVVKIRAVSLNYRDTEVCSGEYDHHDPLPLGEALVPCSDMCGEVVETRSGRFAVGARVLSIFLQTHLTGQVEGSDMESGLGLPLQGVLAEYRVFPADGLVACPEYLGDEEACCLPIAAVTAWMSINGFRPLGRPLDLARSDGEGGEGRQRPTLLVQGTGGVSVAGLQIAQAAGLRTIVTSSSDDKLRRAEQLGAGTAINYRTHWEWQEQVLDATGRRGADFIFETGGQRTLRKSFDSIAFGGTIACIGYLSGKGEEGGGDDDGSGGVQNRLNVNVLALRRNVTLKGILNGPRDRFEEMIAFYDAKKIRPVVDKVFAFEEAKEAFKYLRDGQHFGKVVVRVAEK
ncbi:D-arabinose 1-dehydrogenase, Zn-dependent alcohol dehydrogenase family [Geosmithia morbida]|uniref:D-arabinose 1-dehydrogenase, Zn-dependent alcohol dehydrogenase family n=1 Tax=Geosmithia morbida TaxID=1094350 RepID=A0A9P5CXQ2_9HYPO|nr:D-arabinose 1-dehydrogenase, Zn-dependent alcohol dehydrogenase family [Geosmithia morbida]KAF4119538.1 D-arabinose 1-dehydrogenase, Zn-dependent alcohol dehydrogenase family [Geosmithia morbida]